MTAESRQNEVRKKSGRHVSRKYSCIKEGVVLGKNLAKEGCSFEKLCAWYREQTLRNLSFLDKRSSKFDHVLSSTVNIIKRRLSLPQRFNEALFDFHCPNKFCARSHSRCALLSLCREESQKSTSNTWKSVSLGIWTAWSRQSALLYTRMIPLVCLS